MMCSNHQADFLFLPAGHPSLNMRGTIFSCQVAERKSDSDNSRASALDTAAVIVMCLEIDN